MAEQVVKMTKDGNKATATASAYLKVWKERGWSLAEGETVHDPNDEKTVDVLRKEAADVGIEGRSSMSKQELQTALKETKG